jgi:hypothetical protein
VDVDSGVPGAGVRHSGRKKAAKGARKRAAKRGTAGKKK